MQSTIFYAVNIYNNTNLAHENMTQLVLKQATNMPLMICITMQQKLPESAL